MFFESRNIERIRQEIEQAQFIVITTHKSPDGDAIGSSLGLRRILENMGKKAIVVVPDPFPEAFSYLVGEVKDFSLHKIEVEEAISNADLIFCLDYNDLKRIAGVGGLVANSNATKVMIDHHPFPSDEFDILFSSTNTGSTAEMIFHFIEDLDEYHLLDEIAATALFTGILTDTGSFKYGTTATTFSVASSLVQKGAKSEEIQKMIFDRNSVDRLKLNGFAISEKLEIIEDGKVALISLNDQELERFNFKRGDTEGLVNRALSIEGVEVAVFVSSRDGETRLSFRSKNNIKVNTIASENFQGGGHVRAAGGKSNESVEQTVQELKRIMGNYV